MESGRKRGVMIGGMQLQNPRTKEAFFSLDLVDLDAKVQATTRRIPMKFLAHGFTVDPRRPHIATVLEKKGPGGALVDLRDGKVLRDVPTQGAGFHFYGHGQYSADGSVVYCVETELATRRGLITVRDSDDFRVLEEMPTFGKSPHDCVLLPNGSLVITNGGGPVGDSEGGCVTVVDTRARKLIERVDVSDARINAGHLAVSSATTFAVSSAPRDGLPEKESPGGISFRNDGRALLRAEEPSAVTEKMLGESLSVCVHEASGVAVVTNPWGNLLTIWNARDGRLIESRPMEFPRGVTLTLDGSYFVITHGRGASLGLFAVENVAPAGDAANGAISGSHVYAWDSEMAPIIASP